MTLVLKASTRGKTSLAHSLDGQLISESTDDTVLLLDASTRTSIATLHGHAPSLGSELPIAFLAFTPDGRSIVTASGADETIRVWDIEAARKAASGNTSDSNVVAALSSTGLKDGWLLGPIGELLLWVPSDYRHCIQVPPCTVLISKYRVLINLDQSSSHVGQNWTNCWRDQENRKRM